MRNDQHKRDHVGDECYIPSERSLTALGCENTELYVPVCISIWYVESIACECFEMTFLRRASTSTFSEFCSRDGYSIQLMRRREHVIPLGAQTRESPHLLDVLPSPKQIFEVPTSLQTVSVPLHPMVVSVLPISTAVEVPPRHSLLRSVAVYGLWI